MFMRLPRAISELTGKTGKVIGESEHTHHDCNDSVFFPLNTKPGHGALQLLDQASVVMSGVSGK